MISVMILSDVQLFHDGVASALSRERRIRVLPGAQSERTAIDLVRVSRPNVALVDTAMSGGMSVLRRIGSNGNGVTCIALSVEDEPETVIACAEAGASGYLTRDASVTDLVASIDAAIEGRLRCPPRIALSLFNHVGRLASAHRARDGALPLTDREIEIVELVAEGENNKQIARLLGIGLSTVKNHVHNILGKLGAASRGEAAARWRRTGGSIRMTDAAVNGLNSASGPQSTIDPGRTI